MRYYIDPKVSENIDNSTGLIGVFDILDDSIVSYGADLSFGKDFDNEYLAFPSSLPKSDGYVLYNYKCMVYEIRANTKVVENKSLIKDILNEFNLSDKRIDLVIEEAA